MACRRVDVDVECFVVRVSDTINLALGLVVGTGSVGKQVHGLLAAMGNADRLPHFFEALLDTPDDGLGNCHQHSFALGADLVIAGVKGWRVCLGTSPLMGKHSWLEIGDVALDVTTRDKVLISTVAFHLKVMRVEFARRFPLDGRNLLKYMSLLPGAGK